MSKTRMAGNNSLPVRRPRWAVRSGLAGIFLLLAFSSAGAETNDSLAVTAFLKIFPATKTIGIIYSTAENEARFRSIQQEAQKAGRKVEGIKVDSIKDFPPALDRLKEKADTIWVLDDPIYDMAEAWKYFIMFTLRHQLKTVVSSRRALELGGLFYYSDDQGAVINKRVLDLLGIEPAADAGPITYYGQ